MIIIFFIALFLGINVFSHPLLLVVVIPLFIFIIYRIGKKRSLITLAFFGVGFAISFIHPYWDKEQYKSIVIEVKDNYYIVSSSFEKLYVYEKDHTHEVGDIITLAGEKETFVTYPLESEFNFQEYLNNKGVYSELKFTKKEINFSSPFKINALKKRFLSHFNEDTSGVIRTLFFGYRDNSETVGVFSELHLNRLLSTSGVYLTVLFNAFVFLFKYPFKEKYGTLAANILLIFYSVFTFPRFAVIKFVVLRMLMWINKYPLKEKFAYIDILGATGIFFLVFDFNLAYQDSFILAYFIPLLLYIFRVSFPNMKNRTRRLVTPLLVGVVFMPFALSYYHEFSPLSIFFSLAFIPFMSIFILLIFTSFLGLPIYGFLNRIVAVINRLLKILSPLFFKVYGPSFSFLQIIIFFILLLAIVYFASIKLKDLWVFSGAVFLLFNTLYFIPFSRALRPSVSFINVGQGDACLIDYKGASVLIDTGGMKNKDIATTCLIPYLKSQRIYELDLLITTHDDFDHMGAKDSLFDNFTVKQYVNNYKSFPIDIGNKWQIDNYNVYPDLWKEENDSSLVLGFTISNDRYLVTGDAPKKIENAIIKDHPELRCDILKVGHHGSKTSSGDAFIKQLSPREAVISCGKNNSYGHPHNEVLAVLRKYNIKIRRTDLEGTIKYSYFL